MEVSQNLILDGRFPESDFVWQLVLVLLLVWSWEIQINQTIDGWLLLPFVALHYQFLSCFINFVWSSRDELEFCIYFAISHIFVCFGMFSKKQMFDMCILFPSNTLNFNLHLGLPLISILPIFNLQLALASSAATLLRSGERLRPARSERKHHR